jgi:hypothetical protein
MATFRGMKKALAAALLAGAVITGTGLATGVAQADPLNPPPPPPTADAPHPFCTPRGGLFIIGPICDEIGVYR